MYDVHLYSCFTCSNTIFLQVLEFFAINEWKWSNDNVEKLNKELTEVDKKIFNFDLSTLNWSDFMDDYVKV
jgi:hypothetical protein